MMKRLSKTLMFLLGLALFVGLGITTAKAATNYTPIGGSTTITKNLVVESDANIPDITFAYTINSGTAAAATSTTVEILASDVNASIGSAAFSNADTPNAIKGLPTDPQGKPTAGKKYAQKAVTVSFPDNSFTKPGVYRYVISESNGAKPGVTYDNTPRYLDVFVVANPDTNELSVDSYVLRNTESTISKDGEYTTDPGVKSSGYTNTLTQYDFTFTKAITGNQGDKNKRFTFTLSISNAVPGVYPLETTDVTGNPQTITIGSDGTFSATYDLTNESSFRIINLNKDAVCSVLEDAQDYSPSHTLDGGESTGTASSGEVTLANSDHTVAFTNTRNGIIPTGVLLTIAPFAIGLLLCGAVVMFIMAKRRRAQYL